MGDVKPGSQFSLVPLQPAYVLQIFRPAGFSEVLSGWPDLLASISSISPHLMIVIASV